ncbi:MAG: OmpA family protein [Xanthomonadales bacterium]|nr:OmpA family protein [Xanthomonadales bacterium]
MLARRGLGLPVPPPTRCARASILFTSHARHTRHADVARRRRLRLGQSRLRAEASDSLAKVARFVGQDPGKLIRIEGHTDSTGSANANQVLSQKARRGGSRCA